jgi:uncharacterized repeat protein (TIGR01451 family)/LPXTG-motif cell wall-anchored protein
VTQADVDTGEVANAAFARGHVPGGDEVYSPTAHHIEPVAAAEPALTVKKSATLIDSNGDGVAEAGETIAYTFTVTNTGNVTLTGVSVDDERITEVLPHSVDFLPPSRSYTFTAEPYVVTSADVQLGKVVNVATATAHAPDGSLVVSPEDSVTTDATPPTRSHASDPDVSSVGLASTGGGNPVPPVVGALVLMLLGGILLAVRRRRRIGRTATRR